MLKFVYFVLCIFALAGVARAQDDKTKNAALPAQFSAPPRAYVNGQWYDGAGFRRRTLYVVAGVFTSQKPKTDFETVDLQNGYVLPPLGDAHCHHFDSVQTGQTLVPQYLKDGVFYAQSLGNGTSARRRPDVMAFFNRPIGVDVTYADAALTSTLGHPFLIYESLANGFYGQPGIGDVREKVRNLRKGEGETYRFVETPEMLARVWPLVLQRPPDVLKIMLLESDRYEEKRAKAEPGDNGLPPEIVPEIVKRAHAAGLRVYAHVENAYDFHVCVASGVDALAHLPGYAMGNRSEDKYLLEEADVKAFGKRGGVITPTTWLAPFYTGTKEYPHALEQVRQTQKHNLTLLKKYGVRIAIGSDSYGTGPWPEAEYLRGLGVFTDAELVKIWCETPAVIFPRRKIARLENGYEASFIVVGSDPTQDLLRLHDIRLRVKQGVLVPTPQPSEAAKPNGVSGHEPFPDL